MSELAAIIGWLTSHSMTLFFGAVAAILMVSVLMHTKVSRWTQPFFDELDNVSITFNRILDEENVKDYQVLIGLAAIAFAIFGGLVVLAILGLVGTLATPSG